MVGENERPMTIGRLYARLRSIEGDAWSNDKLLNRRLQRHRHNEQESLNDAPAIQIIDNDAAGSAK